MKRPAAAVQELHARLPAWAALSNLFLDTPIDRPELIRLARRLAASPYSLDELEWILHVELAPVLSANLQLTAGVWDGFDSAWLERRLLARQSSWIWPLRRWLAERRPPLCEAWPALRHELDLASRGPAPGGPRVAGSDPA